VSVRVRVLVVVVSMLEWVGGLLLAAVLMHVQAAEVDGWAAGVARTERVVPHELSEAGMFICLNARRDV
jgi:hypothetical protein